MVRLKGQKTKTMTEINIYKDEFCISTDKAKLDLDAIHGAEQPHEQIKEMHTDIRRHAA